MRSMTKAQEAQKIAQRILGEIPLFWQEVLGSEDADWQGSVRTELRATWADMFMTYGKKEVGEALGLVVHVRDPSEEED